MKSSPFLWVASSRSCPALSSQVAAFASQTSCRSSQARRCPPCGTSWRKRMEARFGLEDFPLTRVKGGIFSQETPDILWNFDLCHGEYRYTIQISCMLSFKGAFDDFVWRIWPTTSVLFAEKDGGCLFLLRGRFLSCKTSLQGGAPPVKSWFIIPLTRL